MSNLNLTMNTVILIDSQSNIHSNIYSSGALGAKSTGALSMSITINYITLIASTSDSESSEQFQAHPNSQLCPLCHLLTTAHPGSVFLFAAAVLSFPTALCG